MENIKDFTIATTFIFITSVCILFFALGYPALNGQTSVLMNNVQFNNTANNLSDQLGTWNDAQNLDINISTSDNPVESAQGSFLPTTTATSRNLISRLIVSFALLTSLLGNVFGLSGGEFAFISGSLIALFGFVTLYFLIKMIRWGQ